MKLNRVIISTDASPTYLPFARLTARAWRRCANLRPTLAVIGDAEAGVPAEDVDVIRVAALHGVDTGLHAQVIRLLLPALFPDDTCLLSDVDMLPLNGRYFKTAVAGVPDDQFVVFRDAAYGADAARYPICYNAGRGSTFGEVFGVRTAADMSRIVREWSDRHLGWNTDELMLYEHLRSWPERRSRVRCLGHRVERRIDRGAWRYWHMGARLGRYVDAHLPRPYDDYRPAIDQLVREARVG